MTNPFVLPDTHYKRDLQVVQGYRQQAATYLELQTGRPFNQCMAFVDSQIKPEGPRSLTDPKALVLTRDENGDRQKEGLSFMKFINRVSKGNLTLSPSMAAYMPESVKQSTHAEFIEEKVALRKVVKGEMFKAQRRGDHEKELVKKGEQNNLKTNNNSYSGATVSVATILYYKSTHSSLTSTCRTATSYANAANEKFLAGNRHYYSPEIIKANLLAIITETDLDAIEEAMETFGLVYPSVDDVMDCVAYSADLYMESPEHYGIIRTMTEGMTAVQRAAVVYVSDLYHLHKHNPQFVVGFLKELAEAGGDKPTSDETFNSYDEDIRLLANFLCYKDVKGRDEEDLHKEDPAAHERVKSTATRVVDTLIKYQSLIKALWLTPTMPSSIHAFPSAYRRAAVVSDTDSTMFTMQYWIEQCFGYVSYSEEATRVVFGMVFLVSEMMLHILAIQSANMGVSDKKLRLLAMKNEFYFAVLSMTTRSKHYYASQDAQEGLMFLEANLEVKGVGLRDSKVPPRINKDAKQMMVSIIETIKAEQPLDMKAILKHIGDIERDIKDSIYRGSYEYMTSAQIKAKESYKGGESAPAYQQYLMWCSVFAPTMGKIKEPPYSVVKVSLQAGNRTEIEAWCDRMENPDLAYRLKQWLADRKRTSMSTLMIPQEIVETTGIPKEIVVGTDIRKIIFNTMGVYYLMLESLGVFLQDKKITRLVSDYY